MVEPLIAERSVINHSEYLTNGRVIISRAINITETEVLTEEGSPITYDYLVIATGHDDPVPKTKMERLEEHNSENKKIQAANSILIIGGGPTGVELAGEIATDFPDKKVTLVHSGSRLLQFIGPRASTKTLKWLTSKNVEVILEESVTFNTESDGKQVYQLSNGKTIDADCHFLCIGRSTSSSWLKKTILNGSLNTIGKLMVDEYLRVKGRKNIFAIGDITGILEIKQGYLAQRHALLAARNLKMLMTEGDESKMATYKPGSSIAIVSLGRRDAVAQLPFITAIGRMPGLIKSRDLFVGKTRKQLGLEPNPQIAQTTWYKGFCK
ncbi:PREDICTED: apoptosis-inducing factor homolog B-like isoform X2 [Nelumbo nucifera]|nr:PREDICTED: apoptosis-inducing factor homolog B-like isoform X2 [Nelumbo nucifera]